MRQKTFLILFLAQTLLFSPNGHTFNKDDNDFSVTITSTDEREDHLRVVATYKNFHYYLWVCNAKSGGCTLLTPQGILPYQFEETLGNFQLSNWTFTLGGAASSLLAGSLAFSITFMGVFCLASLGLQEKIDSPWKAFTQFIASPYSWFNDTFLNIKENSFSGKNSLYVVAPLISGLMGLIASQTVYDVHNTFENIQVESLQKFVNSLLNKFEYFDTDSDTDDEK